MKFIKLLIGFIGWLSYIGLLTAMVCLMAYWKAYPSQSPGKEHKLVKVTAFCPCEKCCGKWADGYTACGHKIIAGDKFCAAPKDMPFGTMLDIPGYGIVPVLDRGGSITEGRLDVYFDEHQAALNWGVKYLIVGGYEKQ
jgi:3D (Asp-Asp-Asp) domain-containing protein